MTLYRIKDWEAYYENSRSRKVGNLSWVPIPNNHDGENFSSIMLHPDGAKIFAAWVLILQVASKCHPRGTLMRDNKKPHTAATLSIKTRAPAEWFSLALSFLEAETDWIETEDFTPACQPGASQVPAGCQSSAEEQNRTEGTEGKEQNRMPPAVVSAFEASFEQFWLEYPKKVAKPEAFKRFKAAFKKVGEDLAVILKALRQQKQSVQWHKDGGAFIPNPATWLNQERWADTIETAPEAAPSGLTAGGSGSETPTYKLYTGFEYRFYTVEKGPEREQFSSDSLFEAAHEAWKRWKGKQ